MYLEQLKLYAEGTPERTTAQANLDEVVATARLKYWSFIKDYLNGIFTEWDSTEANGALTITSKEGEVLFEAPRVCQNLLEVFQKGTEVEKRVAKAYTERKK
jgi:hypothetical protein